MDVKNIFFNPHIEGYVYINGELNRRIGGVGLFIRNNYQYKIVTKFSLNYDECEEIWVELQIPSEPDILLAVIYRHPKPSLEQQFKDNFSETIFNLNNIKKFTSF